MSKEATGQFGAKIGSREYWSKVNRNALLGSLMEDKTNYRAMLQQLGTRANGAIEEIYADLSELGGKIRYLSSSDRKALAKQVEGLYDVCKMGGVVAHHSSECIQGLELSIMSPWTSSFRDERGIEKAIAIIEKSRYAGDDAVKLLKEAASVGGSWAGAALFAKAGAALGIATGPAAPLAIPILTVVGGVVGSIGGSRLADYVIDITDMED